VQTKLLYRFALSTMLAPNSRAAYGQHVFPKVPDHLDWPALTSRIAAGDEAAFGLFYQHFFDRLFRYVLVMTRGNEEASREVLQKTMLKVVRYLKPFPSEAMVWSWLTQAAKTSFIDLLRSQKRGPEFVTLELVDHISHTDKDVEDDDLALETALDKAVQLLGDDEKHLIHSAYFEERSHKDIAESLRLTPKAVESKLGRVRQKIRSLLTRILNDETQP
jgi:RNA polymerase sigma-70 factor (ECF subfamily)